MKPSLISLVDYYATDLSFAANREYRPGEEVQFRAEDFTTVPLVQWVPTEEEPRRWQVTLEVKHEPIAGVNFPYGYRVVLVGFFHVDSAVAAEDEERFVRIQGASVLYGMAREIVRAVTGRGPHRPVLVPTVSFYDPPPNPPASESEETG